VWVVVVWQTGDRWTRQITVSEISAPRFDRWQSGKGLVLLLVLVGLFLFSAVPRGVMALSAAGVLLMSRRMASRDILALVDWHLLVLFAGLFVVNHALAASGALQMIFDLASASGVALNQPMWLFSATAALSNVVSNVPAVMLLLPVATDPMAGPILALVSTLAGNLLVVGSIANIIVIEQARRLGIEITWRDHVRVGAPVTAITLAVTAIWLWIQSLVLTG
jgi:Na+/H+ antiporter NhaD/arsenite permease-like protein